MPRVPAAGRAQGVAPDAIVVPLVLSAVVFAAGAPPRNRLLAELVTSGAIYDTPCHQFVTT